MSPTMANTLAEPLMSKSPSAGRNMLKDDRCYSLKITFTNKLQNYHFLRKKSNFLLKSSDREPKRMGFCGDTAKNS